MTPAARWVALRGSWVALLVSAVGRSMLMMLSGLVLWSALPLLLGWQSTVVMSGSMAPSLMEGDVVVVRPVDPDDLRPGFILLVDDPDLPQELRLHRLESISEDGTLVLRGDANASVDTSPVAPDAVHGIGVLRVPGIGAPYRWLHTRDAEPLLAAAVGFAVVAMAGFTYRRETAPEPTEHMDDAEGGDRLLA